MPVIKENELKSSLNQGEIKPVYIIFGDDGYLIDRYEDIIISKTCGKNNDFDLQKFERDVDLQLVYDSVNQFPFAGERRCAVLSEYNFEKADEQDFQKLLSLVSDTYTTATLVLRFENIAFDSKRSGRAGKLLEACESGGGVAVQLNHRDAAELSKMLQNGAKKKGKLLDKPTADYMVENCGLDINLLAGELDKVCRYVDSDSISKADIDFACTKTVEASVYDYVKRVIACDTRGAIKILNDLFYMRVESMLILYTVSAAFVDMARVGAAGKVHIPNSTVAADFAYKRDFVLKNASANLRKFTDAKLNACFDEILFADKSLKSFSGNDKFILEQMTVKLIYIIAHGDRID